MLTCRAHKDYSVEESPGAPKVDFLTPEALKITKKQPQIDQESSRIGFGLPAGVKSVILANLQYLS